MEHLQDIRMIKDQIIEAEVETKKQRSEVEREKINLAKEENAHKSKIGDLDIEKKQLE